MFIVSTGVLKRSMSKIATSGVMEVALGASDGGWMSIICQVSFTRGVHSGREVGSGSGGWGRGEAVGVAFSPSLSSESRLRSPRGIPIARAIMIMTEAMEMNANFLDRFRKNGIFRKELLCSACVSFIATMWNVPQVYIPF